MHKAGICCSFGTRRASWLFLARLFPPSSDTICLCETLKFPSVNFTVNTQLPGLPGRSVAQPDLGHRGRGRAGTRPWTAHSPSQPSSDVSTFFPGAIVPPGGETTSPCTKAQPCKSPWGSIHTKTLSALEKSLPVLVHTSSVFAVKPVPCVQLLSHQCPDPASLDNPLQGLRS